MERSEPMKSCCNHALMLSLELILEALGDETSDKKFYEYLISAAPTKEQKKIIAGIRDDELKHFKMFRKIYEEITCNTPDVENKEEFEPPECYLAGIEQAILGEQAAVKKYRLIMFGLRTCRHRDMLFEIITDELRHGSLYNMLFTQACCKCFECPEENDC